MTELIRALQKIISIDSSTKDGAVTCLHCVLDLAQSMGMRTGNMNDMVGWAEYGEGEDLVAVLGHLDVVPAGDGWTRPPFGGLIEDGRLYGRGATDDKGPILAALFALYDIKRSGVSLGKRVRILFGTEEETGCEDMKYYVSHGGELPVMGFTPDGAFPLIHGEKGLLIEEYVCSYEPSALKSVWGGTAANIVPDSARAELADGRVLECRGKSAHGAEPWKGVNAAGRLLAELDALHFSGKLGTAVSFLHKRIGMETDGKSLGIAMSDRLSGPLSFNLGMLRANEEELHVQQWEPYQQDQSTIEPLRALQNILQWLDRQQKGSLHSSTQIIIAPGYEYKIVKMLVTNFHQPQSTLLLLVSAFVKGDWRTIYDYALSHNFRFLSYGDSSLLIP